MSSKEKVRTVLGYLPLTAETDWMLRSRHKKGFGRFSLEKLSSAIPEMVAQVSPFAHEAPPGKKVLIFASLHFWIQHAFVTGLALAGLGDDVTFIYLPYGRYDRPESLFDLRRQDIYTRHILEKARPLIKPLSLLNLRRAERLPEELRRAVEKVCVFDTQYILQKEDVTGDEPIYRMRLERNYFAAERALAWLEKNKPNVVIIPNGMIQEFGAFYEVAHYLRIPVVTYEFGEQDQRVWLGQNNLVMFHLTNDLWASRCHRQLNARQRGWLDDFLAARQGMQTGEDFAHLYQTVSRTGGERIRVDLGLDGRPVVLLPTNVMGDSATLGRNLFSKSIAEWIARVVVYFAEQPQVQLVIRIHPAEIRSIGPSIVDVIRRALPSIPEHIHVVGPDEKVNTYDLIEIADLALVFTTTAGLEICTRGIPVAVSGDAHFRGKGFTIDAESWEEYFSKLDVVLHDLPGHRLNSEQVNAACNYAYAYFREYPRPFPWHIEHLWSGLEKRPLSFVLGNEGRKEYEATFQQMTGEPMDWKE
jgi:hypothetical protein